MTYRLQGSIPQPVLEEIHLRQVALLRRKPSLGLSLAQHREQIHKQLFAFYNRTLDQSRDDCLRDPRVAALIRSNLYHHNGSRYHLMSYCIMPNHVHVLFQPLDLETGGPPVESLSDHRTSEPPVPAALGEQCDAQSPLARIMHSMKSYTAHRANEILKRSGTFWQAESYDHWVRDDDELERIVNYIRSNPVKAELVKRHEDWFWCSCRDRFLIDGDCCGWLVATGGPPVA